MSDGLACQHHQSFEYHSYVCPFVNIPKATEDLVYSEPSIARSSEMLTCCSAATVVQDAKSVIYRFGSNGKRDPKVALAAMYEGHLGVR